MAQTEKPKRVYNVRNALGRTFEGKYPLKKQVNTISTKRIHCKWSKNWFSRFIRPNHLIWKSLHNSKIGGKRQFRFKKRTKRWRIYIIFVYYQITKSGVAIPLCYCLAHYAHQYQIKWTAFPVVIKRMLVYILFHSASQGFRVKVAKDLTD